MKKNKPCLRLFLLVYSLVWLADHLIAQPYVDPFQVRYMHAFSNQPSAATPFTHLWAGSDLPVKLKDDTYLLFSPYYEQWSFDSADVEEIYPTVQSFVFPVGLIMPIRESKWTLTVIPIPRWNGEKLFTKNTFQIGGVALATLTRKPTQKFRFGLYANAEFFGLFLIPLLGADWKLDDNDYLFGVLPGRLTYEHRWSPKWYWGATFRAPTHSYRLSNGQFIRLDDNQISLYLDYYLTKHFCITLEPGIGVLRKIRTGIDERDYLTKVNWGDGPFIKLSGAYRIRLDQVD